MKAAVMMIEQRRSVRSPKRKRKQKVSTRRRGKVVDMGRREGWGEQKQTAGNDPLTLVPESYVACAELERQCHIELIDIVLCVEQTFEN